MKFHVKFQGSFSFFEISYKHFGDILAQKPEGSGSVRTVFFFGRETPKWAWKPFRPLIPVFFTGKNRFSRPLFSTFLGFFTATFCFHAHFCDFFHGLKIWFHAQNFRNFHGWVFCFHGHFCAYFLVNIRKRIGASCNEQNPAHINAVYFWTKIVDIFNN